MIFFRKKRKPILPEGSLPERGRAEKACARFAGSVVSDLGCVRENNEDNYVLGKYMNSQSADHSEISVSLSDPAGQWYLAGVFDGIGGGDKGELASQMAARIFLETGARLKEDSTKSNVDLLLRSAFLEANNAIVSLQQECGVLGTTGTVLCTNGVEWKIYHLGDSRAYLIREGRLIRLTRDQTLAQMKIDAGLYQAEGPWAQADKHKLTEYIGRDRTRENLRPQESEWAALRETDRVLLCSDGLYDMCPEAQIAQILGQTSDLERQTRELTGAARDNGGEDNITCIVIAFS